ncbi:MAG TPA: TonB-dependent receptor, partial [Steroidobacteraceae bacterium]
LETEGINACRGMPFPPGGGCFVDEPDRDGYRNRSGSLSVGYRFNDRLQAELRSLIADGHTESDGSFSNEADFAERVTSLHLNGALSASWNARLILGRNEDIQDNFYGGTPAGRFETERDSVSLQFDGGLNESLRAVIGADYQDDHVDSDSQFLRTSRSTTGVFTEVHFEQGFWSAVAGARLEDNEQFGHHTVGNVGVGRRLNEHLRLTATWGTAFRAPTFNELYFPGFGDPTLEPEESRSVELGLDGVWGALRASLHAFDTDFDKLIAFDSATFSPKNIGDARIRGAELQTQWLSTAWRFDGQLTWLDPENRSADLSGRVLPRRAKHSGSLGIRRLLPATQIGAIVRWEGERFDDLANTSRLGGYTTVDLIASHRFGRAWTVQARVANVFDREYETAEFFNQDRRYYSVMLRYAQGE